MDFTKFVALLDSSALYLARSDLLGDPFEGTFSKGNIPGREAFKKSAPYPEEQLADIRRWTRTWTFINCWHINKYESAAMWNIYAQSHAGLAIRSTYATLHAAVDCFLGMVTYIDYDIDIIPEDNTFAPFMHKRRSFAHEREVRLIVSDLPTKKDPNDEWGTIDRTVEPPPGLLKKIDLGFVVKEVYVAPMAAPWFFELVRGVVKKYGFDIPVRQSALDAEPFF